MYEINFKENPLTTKTDMVRMSVLKRETDNNAWNNVFY